MSVSASKITFNDGGKRRSTRRVSIPCNNDNDNDTGEDTPVAKKLRFSPRNFKCCTDIKKLPDELRCSGCVHHKDFGTKAREAHTSKKHQCFKAWTKDAASVRPSMMQHVLAVQDCIENNLNIAVAALAEDDAPPDNDCGNDDEAINVTTTIPVTPSMSPPPKRNITYAMNPVHSQGQCFEFDIPSTHKIVHKGYLSRLEKESEILYKIRAKMQQSQHQTDSAFAQGLWSIALAAVPALAMSAAQFFIPMMFCVFLCDTGLFDYKKFDRTLFARSFPSDNTLRKYSLLSASRDAMLLGHELRESKTCMSCDKGNKKGIGHLAKHLSRWIPGRVSKHLLDIDASGGSSIECAAGTKASVNKPRLNDDDNTHLLSGATADSGGGGTLEKLHECMDAEGLCIDEDECLIGSCCMHCVQIQLKNAACNAFGEGALDKINAMQMLHSVYRLQISMTLDEWRHILFLSSEFVCDYDPTSINHDGLTTAQRRNRESFYEKCDHVLTFHSKFKKQRVDPTSTLLKGAVLAKMKQPILTRWWTVGAGASYLFDYYLVIFYACQLVINLYDSSSTPNGIASDLFSMMADVENFIDMTLIRCFNKAYINIHFDWMQTCKDLTEELGFQAHNIAVRFFLMNRDVRSVMFGTSMEDYHEAVNKACVDQQAETDRHLDKLKIFINEAYDSLHKHFPRWMSKKMIPAALLAEGPFAQVVAAAMLNHNVMPTVFDEQHGVQDNRRMTGSLSYYSTAHKQHVNLISFDNFIRLQLEKHDGGEHTPLARAAAERVSQGIVNLRDIKCDDDQAEMRWKMQTTCLPLASMLQFVESGVKEAKHVSATDRSEAIRSCLAILRSATPLGRSKSTEPELSFAVNKILGIMQSAIDRSDPHVQWKANQTDREYDARLAQVHYSMKQGHFKNDRVGSKKSDIDDRGATFKRPNANQKPKQQTLTAAVTGLIPYGKLTKARNMLDLEEELLFRNVPIEEIPQSITDRKAMLKNLEIERLTAEGVREEDAAKLKTFKKLSDAPFKLTGT